MARHRIGPRWRDPRLAIGVLLVCVSAIASGALLAGPEQVQVYRAASTLLPGAALNESDLVLVGVPRGISSQYLQPSDLRRSGDKKLRSVVYEGELVARTAVQGETDDGCDVVVPLATRVPSSVERGDVVELWRVNATSAELVASQVMVVRLDTGQGSLGEPATAEVRIQRASVGDVLLVLGGDDGFVLVPGEQK
ncbi:hypothetical protein [Actinobaculum sp. 352]|uniref:hypothetical protein n=1 Tax=Actinobaculum sp. 352 TaxID=2490946 RepID=UPI000F7F9502|nr:hypothetical protein [Actinobaculum sp. 352]RTE48999.1 hypothetical protein EKN07_07645 [Actinobaculum sp. 352]